MTTYPPYLFSDDFGENFTPVPESLWKYFGPHDQCDWINGEMLQVSGTQSKLIDYTDMMGAQFLQNGRNPRDIAIWVDQGSSQTPEGEFLEFAAWLWDRQITPDPFTDDPGGTILTAAPCVPDLVQWYWAAPATMSAAKFPPGLQRKPSVPPLQRFLWDLRKAQLELLRERRGL